MNATRLTKSELRRALDDETFRRALGDVVIKWAVRSFFAGVVAGALAVWVLS